MSLTYTHKTLDRFPRELTPIYLRENARFGKTWKIVQDILDRELRQLNARSGSVVISTAHQSWDLRNDGKLRSDARKPEHPGVVIKFDKWNAKEKRYEALQFECDKFTEWKDNVRAIADALEALRKVDRYAVSSSGNTDAHYEGYKAIGNGETTFEMVDAVTFLSVHSGISMEEICLNNFDNENFRRAYLLAAKKLHPDKNNGNDEDFKKLQTFYDLLKQQI